MNNTFTTKSVRRFAASVAVFAGLCLTAACGAETTTAPVPSAPPVSSAPAADTPAALRDAFTAAAKSAPWADKVSQITVDGRAVIVATSLTKTDKAASTAVCEAALKAAKDTKTDFQSVAVRSADDRTLAHQNETAGPKQCEN
ncbi:hypothetical protein DMH01_22930 [Amycolatopsis sp. WAC 04182]|uniref:hypothetical protein n=1 Tax=Amycolatopsis sp. WAC 04182 TaxID=2203198 RepID=UPI000F76BCC5|nr:hypothetical protein [Amycolatopsis sp. WAC 04182]RSN58864.1 hypothetical protein DMH01_22930 [Amycolatopsis sp. WAC 04182]